MPGVGERVGGAGDTMEHLLKQALVGTSKSSSGAEATESPLSDLMDSMTAEQPERKLLLEAGAWAIYRIAGRLPDGGQGAPTQPEPEVWEACSPSAADLLHTILMGEKHLFSEAVELLHQAKRRLPPELLPLALSTRLDKNLRGKQVMVLGKRAQWLGAFRDDWKWIAEAFTDDAVGIPENAKSLWEEGTLPQRLEVLRRVRASDPAMARDWVIQVFPQEKAEPRGSFLECFSVNLSAEDEPFLDKVLDDRAASVRSIALRLLARIPTSALTKRIAERALVMLRQHAHERKIGVYPPTKYDKTWERDGVAEKPPQGTGERAFWLQQTLCLSPPSLYCAQFQSDPKDIIAHIHSDFEQAALLAISDAALVHDDADWMGALWDYWRIQQSGRRNYNYEIAQKAQELFARLSPAQIEARLLRFSEKSDDFRDLLPNVPAPWSEPLGRAAVEFLHHVLRTPSTWQHAYYYGSGGENSLFNRIATAIPQNCLALAAAEIDLGEADDKTHSKYWFEHIQQLYRKFLDVIRTRQRMYQEMV